MLDKVINMLIHANHLNDEEMRDGIIEDDNEDENANEEGATATETETERETCAQKETQVADATISTDPS